MFFFLQFCRYGEGRSHRENRYRYETDDSHYEKDDPRYERRHKGRPNDRVRDAYGRYGDDRYGRYREDDRESRDEWGKLSYFFREKFLSKIISKKFLLIQTFSVYFRSLSRS